MIKAYLRVTVRPNCGRARLIQHAKNIGGVISVERLSHRREVMMVVETDDHAQINRAVEKLMATGRVEHVEDFRTVEPFPVYPRKDVVVGYPVDVVCEVDDDGVELYAHIQIEHVGHLLLFATSDISNGEQQHIWMSRVLAQYVENSDARHSIADWVGKAVAEIKNELSSKPVV